MRTVFKVLLAIAVIFLIAVIAITLKFSLKAFTYNHAEYCYDWTMGGKSYRGIPNKFCICDGEIIGNCPIGAACDSGQIRCDGEILGFQYYFMNADKTFRTLEEFEQYCPTLESQFQQACFWQVNRTRALERS
jgi:hypothetical protein